MNSTAENTGISWETIDGQPVAHLRISMDAGPEQLLEVGRRIYATIAEMQWSAATLLEVGSLGRGVRGMHLARKSAYEQNHSASALCGRPGPWDVVHVLQTSVQGGFCKKCLARLEGEGGEHGSK